MTPQLVSSDITSNLLKGDHSKLVKFYNRNNIQTEKLIIEQKPINTLNIMTYNIHSWININKNISVADNYHNIMRLISYVSADIVTLQEVCFIEIEYKQFQQDAYGLGYKYLIKAHNGGCFYGDKLTDFIVTMSKYPITNAIIMDTSVPPPKDIAFPVRETILAQINLLSIAEVHLEIGERFHQLALIKRNKIIRRNSKNRIDQLRKIIMYKPDIIIGDFNFTPDDTESIWLQKNGYDCIARSKKHTTPYNRTDMLFVKRDLDYSSSIMEQIIPVNFSDHLPVLYQL